jgi:hypothetical protein
MTAGLDVVRTEKRKMDHESNSILRAEARGGLDTPYTHHSTSQH